jgi:hypothetical protein
MHAADLRVEFGLYARSGQLRIGWVCLRGPAQSLHEDCLWELLTTESTDRHGTRDACRAADRNRRAFIYIQSALKSKNHQRKIYKTPILDPQHLTLPVLEKNAIFFTLFTKRAPPGEFLVSDLPGFPVL